MVKNCKHRNLNHHFSPISELQFSFFLPREIYLLPKNGRKNFSFCMQYFCLLACAPNERQHGWTKCRTGCAMGQSLSRRPDAALLQSKRFHYNHHKHHRAIRSWRCLLSRDREGIKRKPMAAISKYDANVRHKKRNVHTISVIELRQKQIKHHYYCLHGNVLWLFRFAGCQREVSVWARGAYHIHIWVWT